jgi:CheY-like chemotaxis protein
MATILVVDDRPSNREYLLTLLAFAGHRALEAHDGAQALELVRASYPDLIITDILMPTMDGYEFVQRLRADPALAATRVIFYSAVYAERETLEMAASCGVHTVLGKPSDPQAIFDAVNAELGLHVPAPAPAAPLPPEPAFEPPGDGIGERLAALEQMCLRLVGERRPQALVEVFLQAAGHILEADCQALCLLESDETHVRHLAAHGVDKALLAATRGWPPCRQGTRRPAPSSGCRCATRSSCMAGCIACGARARPRSPSTTSASAPPSAPSSR